MWYQGHLSVKMPSYQCKTSHHKEKTFILSSYLYNRNPYIYKDGLYIETDPRNCPCWPVGSVPCQGLYILAIDSLAPGRPGCHFKTAIFNFVLLIGIFTSSNDNALRWIPGDLADDKSTLVQVMAWCRQATSHYLSQCWPSSMSPYGMPRPQCVLMLCDLS